MNRKVMALIEERDGLWHYEVFEGHKPLKKNLRAHGCAPEIDWAMGSLLISAAGAAWHVKARERGQDAETKERTD